GQAWDEISGASRLAPARRVPAVGRDGDDVDEAAGSDRIMHQVSIVPEPEMDQGLAEFGRYRIRRDQASPRGSPGKARRLVIAEAFAQHRPQPIGRQQGEAVLL